MRFNKQELAAFASQTSLNFDREGVMVFKERQDGFFRRAEISTMRWYRLRGNLLFYLRGPEQWSEPYGVIVLENHSIQLQNQDDAGHWPFQIVCDGGCYKMALLCESERDILVKIIQRASHNTLKGQITALKEQLQSKHSLWNLDIKSWRAYKKLSSDINEVPLCELALSCDNLLCHPHGRLPSSMIVIHVNLPNGNRFHYASTEVIENCSNPSFARTIMFHASDGLSGDTEVQLTVYDVRELFSQTAVPLGFAKIPLSTIQDSQRLRITLNSHDKTGVGFITVNGWRLESSAVVASPKRQANGPNSMDVPQKALSHKRSHSLPPRLGVKLKLPLHGNVMRHCFANSYQVTYRFHSGLGGDIKVHELMAESKLCFQLPMQLLGLYIQREIELLQEILSIGELKGEWKNKQLELLNTHLYLLQHYSKARLSMLAFTQSSKDQYFKESSKKDDMNLDFAPLNLHLQRMWAYNDTINKSGFHDIITVGAFTAHTHKVGCAGGLIRLVQELKHINSTKVSASRVQMASDAVQAIKQLRSEIVVIMNKLLALANIKETRGMLELAEEMVSRTKALLTLWDPGLVEEALSFIEWHKVTPPVKAVENLNNSSSQIPSPFKQLTQHLNMLDLCSRDVPTNVKLPSYISWSNSDIPELSTPVRDNIESIFGNSMVTDANMSELYFDTDHFDGDDSSKRKSMELKDYSHIIENSQSVHSIEGRLTERCDQVPDDMCDVNIEKKKQDITENKFDVDKAWSHLSDEPEPFDITQLNIEASVMCLVSKVKFLCGRCGSPAVRLRNKNTKESLYFKQSITRPRSLNTGMMDQESNVHNLKDSHENIRTSLADTDMALEETVDSVRKLVKKGNKFTEGLKLEEVDSWSAELSPPMRKLEQAMRGLLNSGRLARAALRLCHEDAAASTARAALQARRDTCFTQAVTALTTGLMCWLWSSREEFIVTLLENGLGPLCGFEGLLTLYDKELNMWGDHVVAIEDLQTVVFMLVKSNYSGNNVPQIMGSRNALTVVVPVPDSLYTKFTIKECLSFTITAVFFNIGINEKASLAEELGEVTPQDKSNTDNFDRLNKYYHKYKKVFPQDHSIMSRSSSRVKPLEEVMETLRITVNKRIVKNCDVLQLAALAIRHMNGVRITSCKSAKDRTGMSCTLEQCTILSNEYHLAEHEFVKALNVMRSEGCRRENSYKNTGVRKYAFNKIQIAALPKHYRAPPGSYGSTQT